MPEIIDPEFGVITIRRASRSHSVRVRVAPNGRLRASVPLYTPLFFVKRVIASSRAELRTMLADSAPADPYYAGQQIGKSHTLRITSGGDEPRVSHHGQQIIVHVPLGRTSDDPAIQRLIRDAVITALRKEAKSYLPRRLRYLANELDASYERVRFSHASGRWGSCSSNGTISLNIALMKLPFELIDYVLVHELSHTYEMNHSAAFWSRVAQADPDYKTHRRDLKTHTPTV